MGINLIKKFKIFTNKGEKPMKKILARLWELITLPIIAVMVLIDDSKRYNEDGSWYSYHAKRNEKEMKKEKTK
jgi:hypothetical protein